MLRLLSEKFRLIRVIIDIPSLASMAARAIKNRDRARKEGCPRDIEIKKLNVISLSKTISSPSRIERKKVFLYIMLRSPIVKEKVKSVMRRDI